MFIWTSDLNENTFVHQSEIKTKHNFDNFHIVSQPLISVYRR